MSDGFGRPHTGGLGGLGGERWNPLSPDPRHPKIAALINPYLELTNGKLLLPSILDADKIWLEDLPGLNKYKNPTTGRNVLGPCHFLDCYFGQREGHPDRADFSNKFVEQVVQVLGPEVAARMTTLHALDGKMVKMEPGAPNV